MRKLELLTGTAAILLLASGAWSQDAGSDPKDCTAAIGFANCPEGNLDPAGNKEIELSWHATAKGKDCGACVISCTAIFTNADGTLAILAITACSDAKPTLPHLLEGKAGGGTIKLGKEKDICTRIAKIAGMEHGIDRLCITISITCTKGRQVVGHDDDVCCLVCPPK